MQQYQNVIQDKFGNVIVGASVAVYVYGTTTPATIYSGNGSGILPSNTVTTNSLGEFSFYAANGRYSLSVSATNFVAENYTDFILYDPADIGAVAASNVAFTPFGTVSANNVQNAIQEVVVDLAGAAGSSLVGFVNSGTGATTRTVQAKLRDTVSVKDFGATGDGVTDDTAAIQAALDYGANSDICVYAVGTFKITSKVVIKGNADFSQATFNVYSTPAVAVEVSTGNATDPTTILFNAQVLLPDVINMTKPASGWAGQGTGVRIVNAYSCNITVRRISNFASGLVCTSYGTGTVYNNISVGWLENNKINLTLQPGNSSGWVNENNFIGGSYAINSGEGSNITGCYHIYIPDSTNVVNNNLFIRPGIEGDGPQYHVYCAGSYNTFQQARWEATTPKLLFTGTRSDNAIRNMILGGYDLNKLSVTYSGTTGKNNVMFGASDQVVEMGTSAKSFRFQNINSSSDAIHRFFEAGLNPWANGSDWSVSHAAQTLEGKRSTDSYSRIKLDYVNGRLYAGDGTAVPTAYIGAFGATGFASFGTWYPGADNTYALGSSSYRWNNTYSVNFRPGAGTATWTSGAGTPEGVVTATVGSLFTRTDGGANTTLYVKESGTGNTGWVAK